MDSSMSPTWAAHFSSYPDGEDGWAALGWKATDVVGLAAVVAPGECDLKEACEILDSKGISFGTADQVKGKKVHPLVATGAARAARHAPEKPSLPEHSRALVLRAHAAMRTQAASTNLRARRRQDVRASRQQVLVAHPSRGCARGRESGGAGAHPPSGHASP